jgi:hypothetical protein
MEDNLYQYIGVTTDQIRIVRLCPGSWRDKILCEMRIVEYRAPNRYEALSYVWGSEANKRMILVDGCCFAITPNLESALRRLRWLSKERWLWIDQLCIDQSNDKEKSEQVSLMSHIYQNALEVLIWLGDQNNLQSSNSSVSGEVTSYELKIALELVSVLSDDRHLSDMRCFELLDGHRLQVTEYFSTGLDMLSRLMQKPWWTRIWTVQEIVLARQASFLIGPDCITWDDLEKAALNVRKHRGNCCHGLFGTLTQKYFVAINEFYLPIFDIARYRDKTGFRDHVDLIVTLHRFRNRLATDPRDKVYGLSGLIQHDTLTVDYHRHFDHVYIDLMMSVIEDEKSLRVLLDTKLEGNQQGELPSWVIDWRTPANSSRLRIRLFRFDQYRSFPYLPTAPRLIRNSLLQLFGFRIDQIAVIQCAGKFPKGSYVYAALEKIQAIAASNFTLSDLYIAGGTFEEAFWRTMLGNLVWEASRYRPVIPDDYALYKAFRSARRPWSQEDAFHNVANTVEQSLFDRAFFMTTEGYMGIGPPNIRAGDDIFVVLGSNVPLVLRNRNESITCEVVPSFEVGATLYSFIGDSYVHGLMNGEVRYEPGREIRPIVLC